MFNCTSPRGGSGIPVSFLDSVHAKISKVTLVAKYVIFGIWSHFNTKITESFYTINRVDIESDLCDSAFSPNYLFYTLFKEAEKFSKHPSSDA
jgi:hypothetical protein